MEQEKRLLDESEKLYREALALHRKLFGNEDLRVATDLTGLAEVLFSKGEIQETISLLNEALTIPEEKMRVDSIYRARAESALGAALTRQQKYPEAETMLLDAHKILSVREKGTKRPSITLKRIIDLYQVWDRPEKAEPYPKLLLQEKR